MKSRYSRFRGPPHAAFEFRFRPLLAQRWPDTHMPQAQFKTLWDVLARNRSMGVAMFTLRDRYVCGLFHRANSVQHAHARWWQSSDIGEGVVPWI